MRARIIASGIRKVRITARPASSTITGANRLRIRASERCTGNEGIWVGSKLNFAGMLIHPFVASPQSLKMNSSVVAVSPYCQ